MWLFDHGQTVDHFRVLRPLGKGGMAQVFLARDTKLGRKVALKVIQPEALGSDQAIERFLFEARATAKFNHPNIVTIHVVGETNGKPYVALEYVEGQTLRQRLDQGPLAIAEATRLGQDIVGALVEAHAAGIIHRDLKPDNVMLGRDGRLRVMDFGLARRLARPGAGGALADAEPLAETVAPDSTAEGSVVAEPFQSRGGIRGTPAYMAPEQWREQEVSAATDIWALGVILYELVAGERPYGAQSLVEQALVVCDMEPVPRLERHRPEAPARLVALVHSCLEKEAAKRPTAQAVGAELRQLLSARPGQPQDPRPFRGLLPFGEEHATLFFGREAEVTAFVERLREEVALPVMGPSGSGKSSFVRAGVIPRLREQGPLTLVALRPGSRPLLTLAQRVVQARTGTGKAPTGRGSSDPADLGAQLRRAPELLALLLETLATERGGQVLLFVDQLEEVFTLVEDSAEQRAFVRAVAGAADDAGLPVRVVYTLREEFLGRLAEAGAAPRSVTVLKRPGAETLEQILVRQAAAAGLRFEDEELPREMVAEVSGEVACLPLLQFAGERLWEERDAEARILRRQTHRAMGGVAGALAQHADGVLTGFSPAELKRARAVLLRLVTSEGTRRVTERRRLLEGMGPGAGTVLDRLVGSRLLTSRQAEGGEEVVELAHEALVGSWGRLGRWLEQSREERQFLEEVGQAAELWEKRGRAADEVWTGAALRDALHRLELSGPQPEHVAEFLQAGKQRETRKVRARRLAVGSVLGVLCLATLAGVIVSWALRQKEQQAQHEKAAAVREQKAAVQQRALADQEGAAAALLRDALPEARAKLRSALEVRDSPEARALWWKLQRGRTFLTRRMPSGIYGVAFSPDGGQIAAAGQDHSIALIDIHTGKVRVLRGHTDQVFSVDYSPDGHLLGSGTWGGAVRLWNLRTGESQRLSGHTDNVWGLAFSHSGRQIATSSKDESIRVWDVASGKTRLLLRVPGAEILSVSFSPDDSVLAAGCSDRTVRLWHLPSGEAGSVLRGHTATVSRTAFSPDGRTLGSASWDRTVRLWDVATGTLKRTLAGHDGQIWALAFGPRGKRLASADSDSHILLWSVDDTRPPEVLIGHTNRISGVDISPDGRLLVSGGLDRTVRLWRLTEDAAGEHPPPGQEQVWAATFSPDGRRIASGGADGVIRIWDPVTGQQLRRFEKRHQGRIAGLSFSPDGTLLASAGWDHTVRLWTVTTGRQQRVLRGHGAPVWSVAFSPEGNLIASGGSDYTTRIWNATTGRLERTLRGHSGLVCDVSFSRKGDLLASASWDKTIRLWRTPSGRLERVLQGNTGQVWSVAFNPASIKPELVSSGSDGVVRLWDVHEGTSRVVARQPGRGYWLDFSPNGLRVGVPSADGIARIWRVAGDSGDPIELRGHRAEINVLRFGPSGQLVVTGSDDSTVRLWHADSGQPVWRAPLLLRPNMELATHRGWIRLDDGKPAGQGREQWRAAVLNTARKAAQSDDGGLLCLAKRDAVEMWDLKNDRRLVNVPAPRVRQVLALPNECVVLFGQTALQLTRSGKTRTLSRAATAIDVHGPRVIVATLQEILVFERGKRMARIAPAFPGITALRQVGGRLALGFGDGGVEVLDRATGSRRPLEDVPSSAVVNIKEGPKGTLAVGFANGFLGLWSEDSGSLLHGVRLHGPVVHLAQSAHKLYAASELGDHVVVDLGIFYSDYCDVLRQVWKEVPVVWQGGELAVQPPSRSHICRSTVAAKRRSGE